MPSRAVGVAKTRRCIDPRKLESTPNTVRLMGFVVVPRHTGHGQGLKEPVDCTARTLQLIGVVLHWVFIVEGWYVVVALALAMTLIAGVTAIERTQHGYRGVFVSSIVSVWASSWLIAGFALLAVLHVQPWYRPQYAIPLLGMILGNTLSGISLGLDRFGNELDARRDGVEMLLALGASSWEGTSDWSLASPRATESK